MISQRIPPKCVDTCPDCDSPISVSLRYCPTCSADLGAPNVRLCQSDENKEALSLRYHEAYKKAGTNGCSKEFEQFEQALKDKSGVVITMPALVARNLFENPKDLYANYEQLVGAKARIPAALNDDCRRSAVAGKLFGSYANEIIYGVLSLTNEGLTTYGEVCCRLKNNAIERRTSFLETNSFRFIEEQNITAATDIPLGYTAGWEDRQLLVLTKLVDLISVGHTESDWQQCLISSDGHNREGDEFVEAHIYGSLNRYAVESVVAVRDKKFSKSQQLDIDLTIDMFKKNGATKP